MPPVEVRQALATCAPAGHVAAGRAVGDPVGQETLHRASIKVDREDEPPLPALGGAKGKARGAVVGRDLLRTARGLAGQDVGSEVRPRDQAACSDILSGL